MSQSASPLFSGCVVTPVSSQVSETPALAGDGEQHRARGHAGRATGRRDLGDEGDRLPRHDGGAMGVTVVVVGPLWTTLARLPLLAKKVAVLSGV